MKRVELLKSLDIGASIKRLREKKGLSQEELAKDICDRTNITKLENGYSKIPSLSFVLLICEKLDVTIEEFLNFAMSNNYSIDKKYVLDLLLNDDMTSLENYLTNINPSYLSKNNQTYYKYLMAKVKIYNGESKIAKDILLEIISSTGENYLKLLSYHELFKNNYIDSTTNMIKEIFSKENLFKLVNKRNPIEYFYLINDLLTINFKNNNYEYCKYLLELEISFLNNHDYYRFLPIYYKNKMALYKDDIFTIRDIENKLLAIEKQKR